MKITGPGAGAPPPEVEAPVDPGRAAPAEAAGTVPSGPVADPTPGSAFEALAADLKAGRLTPAAAVEAVLGRVIDAQVGADAPAAVRQRVEAALRDALEHDPFLAEKLRALAAR